MFKFIKNNKVIPKKDENFIEKCRECNSKIFLNTTTKCTVCGKDILKFVKDENINKDTIENFLKNI